MDYTIPNGQPFDPANQGNVAPGGTTTTVTVSAPTVPMQILPPPMWGLGEENEVPALCMARIAGVAGLALSTLTWDSECNQFMYPGHPLYEAAMRADQIHACKQGIDAAISEMRRRLDEYLQSWVPDPVESAVGFGLKGGIVNAIAGARGAFLVYGIAAGAEGALIGGIVGGVTMAASAVITDPLFWPLAKGAMMAAADVVLEDWRRMGFDNCDGVIREVPELRR
ncbi:MAG: hypothetical protein R2729_32490 [Bryobacteraceae bacterium]